MSLTRRRSLVEGLFSIIRVSMIFNRFKVLLVIGIISFSVFSLQVDALGDGRIVDIEETKDSINEYWVTPEGMLKVSKKLHEVTVDNVEGNFNLDLDTRMLINQRVKSHDSDSDLIYKERSLDEWERLESINLYNLKKDDYFESRADYFKIKKEYLDFKEELKLCNESSLDCDKPREDYTAVLKSYLLNIASLVTDHVVSLIEMIKASETISDDQEDEMLKELDSILSNVGLAANKIENGELIEGNKILKPELEKTKVISRYYVHLIVNSGTGLIIKKAENFQLTFEEIKTRMLEDGRNDDVYLLIDQYDESLDRARELYNYNLFLLEEIHFLMPNLNELKIKEIYDLIFEVNFRLKDTKQELAEVHYLLQKITNKLDRYDYSDLDNCWSNRPRYNPGEDLGFFIWQDTCTGTWNIDWSNSSDSVIINRDPRSLSFIFGLFEPEQEKLMPSKISGRITSNGEFYNVGVKSFDSFDELSWNSNVIDFKGSFSVFDGLRFDSTGDRVKLELNVDGRIINEIIYIGSSWKNPINDVLLSGIPGKNADVCEIDHLMYWNSCVSQLEDGNKKFKVESRDNLNYLVLS